ncbi:MAG: hypothetical protein EOO10_07905, partial [Chitinophagaceae bacterium]
KKIYRATQFWPIHLAWTGMQKKYNREFPFWPDVPVLLTSNINSQDAYNFTASHQPDLVVVSGTSLVKEPLLSVPVGIGIMNLHTGLSPYIKGGPNCTNWCIAENKWHMIGNTIMWINAGIDTGNIITTEQVDILNCRSLLDVQVKIMEEAHRLYCKAIGYVLTASAPYNSVPQNKIAEGRIYYTKMWTDEKKKQLLRNWRRKKNVVMEAAPQTVPLPNY